MSSKFDRPFLEVKGYLPLDRVNKYPEVLKRLMDLIEFWQQCELRDKLAAKQKARKAKAKQA